MAETTPDWPLDRAERHDAVLEQILAVVAGEGNATARYATAACILHHAFAPRFLWTGFYVVDPMKPTELVVGPYQGTLGCLRIPFGRGVCGAVASTGRSERVADVHAFEGHIACDARSRSELVVPVFGPDGALAAVLDVDSAQPDAFCATDQAALEKLGRTLLVG